MFRWLLIAACAVPLFGQAAVESAVGTGRASTAVPAQKIGKSVGAVADSLSRTLKAAPAKPSTSTTVTLVSTAKPEAAPAPAPARKYEDPALIQTGLSYEDVLRRFGPPSMQITTGASARSLSYAGVQVEIDDGKVTAVARPKS